MAKSADYEPDNWAPKLDAEMSHLRKDLQQTLQRQGPHPRTQWRASVFMRAVPTDVWLPRQS